MSPYLAEQSHDRTLSEVMMDRLKGSDLYAIVDISQGDPYLREADPKEGFRQIVNDIATGQYTYPDKNGPVAVVRLSFADGTIDDVTDAVSREVASYITTHADSKNDPLWNCPFLDACWPGWRLHCFREWDAEEGYLDDCRFEGRYVG